MPPNFTLNYDWLPAAAVIGGTLATALLAVLVAGRRAARVRPTLALTDAAVEPRLLGPARVIGGLLALAAAVPLFTVSTTTRTPETAAATSEMNAIFLVVAVAFLGPIVAYAVAHTCPPARLRRSSASPRWWRYWRWRYQPGMRCARGR
jgi:putative ABC transport system permease protein